MDADADPIPPGNDVTIPVISRSHNLGHSPAGGPLSRLLTWNCAALNGATLLEVETKAHDTKADVICVTETELPTYDSPEIQGYTMFLPKVSNSTKIRTVMYVRRSLYATQVPTPEDVPLVAARVDDTVIIGIYRQWCLIAKSGTRRGSAFESEQMAIIETAIRTISA